GPATAWCRRRPWSRGRSTPWSSTGRRETSPPTSRATPTCPRASPSSSPKIEASRLPAPTGFLSLTRSNGSALTEPRCRTVSKEASVGIFVWIVIGLLAGLIARAIMPGKQPGGIIVTILLGIAGGLLGGWLGSAIVGRGLTGFSFWSLLLAVVGALILLFVYQLVANGMEKRRHRTG